MSAEEMMKLTHSFGDATFHGARQSCCHAKASVVQDIHSYLEPPTHTCIKALTLSSYDNWLTAISCDSES